MKILFCTFTFVDYGLDILFDGLCQYLGEENVFDYPHKNVLHKSIYENQYPSYFDYPIFKTDLEKLEILESGEFDAIFIGVRPEKKGIDFTTVLNKNRRNIPIYIIDMSDTGEIDQEMINKTNSKLYFKREYFKNKKYSEIVKPLSLSYSIKYCPKDISGKRISDYFWAGRKYSHHKSLKRVEYLVPLESKKGKGFHRNYNYENYCKELLKYKIGISLHGYGSDTIRYYEIPAHGALLLAQRQNIIVDNDFKDGETAVFFDNPEEMLEKLDYCLKHEDYVDKIRLAGYNWFHKYHTSKVRAEQLIDKIK